MVERLAAGAAVCALGAFAVYRLRAIDRSGAITGFLVGTVLWTCLGWRGFVLLALFVVLGSAATRLGYAAKARAGVAQEHGGTRGVRNVLANGAVATIAAVSAVIWPESAAPVVAFCGALATAASDTLASEIGGLVRGPTVLVTRLRRVAPGTDGGVSWAGSLAGVAAAFAMALLAVGVDLLPLRSLVATAAGGVAGNLADSVLGATLETRGRLDNEGVNLAATLVGALTAVTLAAAGAP